MEMDFEEKVILGSYYLKNARRNASIHLVEKPISWLLDNREVFDKIGTSEEEVRDLLEFGYRSELTRIVENVEGAPRAYMSEKKHLDRAMLICRELGMENSEIESYMDSMRAVFAIQREKRCRIIKEQASSYRAKSLWLSPKSGINA